MAGTLSSNWKKLQETIKAESTRPPPADISSKRKRHAQSAQPAKKQKLAVVQSAARDSKNTGSDAKDKSRAMGVVQSSKVDAANRLGVSPSLALWANDNDVSPEDLAEAYDLGLKGAAKSSSDADRINCGLAEHLQLGKYVAIDCEMVGIGPGGYDSALARLSLVDYHGTLVYDSFVKPRERVVDWRTAVSGISPKDMRFARDFDEVQSQAAELLQGRILIGHDVKHDLNALELIHPPSKIRDTSSFSGFRQYAIGRKPALRTLAREILKLDIQVDSHSSIEDARVTMLLFRKFKSGFDTEYANRFPEKSDKQAPPSKTVKAKKKKRKT